MIAFFHASGVPLAIRTAGGERQRPRSDSALGARLPEGRGHAGPPEGVARRPVRRSGYDSEATRAPLRWPGIEPHIAKRKTAHGSGLGKIRWVAERTISWLKGLRRLRVRVTGSA